ncbi:MAG: COG3650 family protein [Flavisolibacter sp.]
MRNGLYLLIILISSCTLPEEKGTDILVKADTTSIQTNASYDARSVTPTTIAPVAEKPKIKNPTGIYHVVIPFGGKMEQTIAFYNDHSYQLQEKYILGKKDSIVLAQGNWSPSDGFIWLYKDQVVRGRYKWSGDVLQYFSPSLKQSFSMQPLRDALDNNTLSSKKNEGIAIMGLGNEPFWNIQVKKQDTISFLMSEWKEPLNLKITSTSVSEDSTSYLAGTDSAQLKLTVFPYFCTDGMSDYVYRNKVRIEYKKQVLNGCGIIFK